MHRGAAVLLALALPAAANAAATPVNAIVGDASFVERFGRLPTAMDDRDPSVRVRVHLRWVARELRRRSQHVSDPALRAQRARLLDALDAYTARGEFPINRHFSERRPRFADEERRLCAVGHLIAVSVGRSLADAIAERFEYDYLLEIDDPRLAAWVGASGFSARELAMIQPEYAPGPDPRPPFEAGDYATALRIFEERYLLSGRPALLYNIAVCAERLGRNARALEAYRAYLRAVPETELRVRVEQRIVALESAVRREQAQARREQAPHPRAQRPPPVAPTARGCACAMRSSARSEALGVLFVLIFVCAVRKRLAGASSNR